MASVWPQRTEQAGRRASDFAYWTFSLQLWTVWALALSNAFMGLSALAVIWRRVRTGSWRVAPAPLVPRPLALPLAAFVLVFLASTAFSYQPQLSLDRVGEPLALLPLLLALATVRGEAQARLVIRGLVAMGALVAGLGLLQVLIGGAGVDLSRRMPGPFSHYQTFAGVLLLTSVLALVRLVCGPRRGAAWTGLALAIVLVALSLDLTRGSWVALAGAVTFVLAVRRPRHLLWVAPAAVALVLALPAAVRERAASILDLREGSNYDRLCMIDAGLRMVAERPLLGLGPGVVERRYSLYRHPTAPRDRRPHLHDAYLQIAAEYGLPALVAFVAIFVASFKRTIASYRREGGAAGPHADLHLGVATALVAYTLAALFEDNWADTEVQKIALFVIALPFCLDSPQGETWPSSSTS